MQTGIQTFECSPFNGSPKQGQVVHSCDDSAGFLPAEFCVRRTRAQTVCALFECDIAVDRSGDVSGLL